MIPEFLWPDFYDSGFIAEILYIGVLVLKLGLGHGFVEAVAADWFVGVFFA